MILAGLREGVVRELDEQALGSGLDLSERAIEVAEAAAFVQAGARRCAAAPGGAGGLAH